MVSLSSAPSLQRDIEAEMKRLKLELKQTMDMYSSACKEAISAKNKVHIYIILNTISHVRSIKKILNLTLLNTGQRA